MQKLLPNWLKVFESKLIEVLEKARCNFSVNYPDVKFTIFSDQWGQEIGVDGYIISLNCLWSEHLNKEIDLVDFAVYFIDIRTQPKFVSDICWVHPSGYIEDEFNGSDVFFNAVTEADFFAKLVKLIASLEAAVKRGEPVRSDQVEYSE